MARRGPKIYFTCFRSLDAAQRAGHFMFTIDGEEYVLLSTVAYITGRSFANVRSWVKYGALRAITPRNRTGIFAEPVYFVSLRQLYAFAKDKPIIRDKCLV